MTETYTIEIDGLMCEIEQNLTEASAPVWLTLISTIREDERRKILIGQTADARHRDSGVREMALEHLIRESGRVW